MSKEQTKATDYLALEVVAAAPRGHWSPGGAENVFARLVGAQIVAIGGTSSDVRIEGGGLIIDYKVADSTEVKRVVLAFNDCGMWVEYDDE